MDLTYKILGAIFGIVLFVVVIMGATLVHLLERRPLMMATVLNACNSKRIICPYCHKHQQRISGFEIINGSKRYKPGKKLKCERCSKKFIIPS